MVNLEFTDCCTVIKQKKSLYNIGRLGVLDITAGEIGVKWGTMVVTVEGWFIIVVGAW